MINKVNIQEFEDFCKNKNILLVGNSVNLVKQDNSELIDSYDIVVRFGWALEPPLIVKEVIGTKLDVWVAGIAACIRYSRMWGHKGIHKILNDKIVLFNRSRQRYSETETYNYLNPVEEHALSMFTDKEIQDTCSKYSIDIKATRISAGIWTVLFFIDKIKEYNSLDLIGFDSFTSKNVASTSGFCHSWHGNGLRRPTHDGDFEAKLLKEAVQMGLINKIY